MSFSINESGPVLKIQNRPSFFLDDGLYHLFRSFGNALDIGAGFDSHKSIPKLMGVVVIVGPIGIVNRHARLWMIDGSTRAYVSK